MANSLSVQDFFRRFPDDDTCLNYLMRTRYGKTLDCPKCGKHGKFHRIKRHPAFECAWCGFEIFPMVGTPFHRTHTPLQKWFYAIYLFTTSRHGVSAKELQRQLSVTYKTAWRMGHEIRQHMADVDGDPPLTGHVEIDETYVGGRRPGRRGRSASGKTIVFGILERKGQVFTTVIPDTTVKTIIPQVLGNVPKGTRVSTDGLSTYKALPRHGYPHQHVNHEAEEWVRGDVHVNGLEGFWSILKRSILGTHVHVSPKHLPKYLGEFEFRYNLRKRPNLMFDRLLQSL